MFFGLLILVLAKAFGNIKRFHFEIPRTSGLIGSLISSLVRAGGSLKAAGFGDGRRRVYPVSHLRILSSTCRAFALSQFGFVLRPAAPECIFIILSRKGTCERFSRNWLCFFK